MSMVSPALVTLGTVVWPFVKEWLLGMKDHPHQDGRTRQLLPSRIVIIMLVIACANLVFYASTLNTDILTLKRKHMEERLMTAAKNPGGMSKDDFRIKAELKYDLIACTSRADVLDKTMQATLEENRKLKEINSKLVKAMSTSPPPQSSVSEPDASVKSIIDRIKRL